MTITEFLTARLDEDEHQARLTIENRTGPPARALLGPTDIFGHMEVQPEHVLADIAAKRAIVALLIQSERTLQEDVIDEATLLAARHGLLVAQMACRSLTQPYAEHPDFNPAWRV